MTPKALAVVLVLFLLAAFPAAATVSIFPSFDGSSAPVLPGTRVVSVFSVSSEISTPVVVAH